MEPKIISTARWIIAMSLVQPTRADNATCGHSVWGIIEQNKDNSTALNTMPVLGWVPEPEVRGTFSILLTCVLTLVACIYSALHLNIPYDTRKWPMLRTKAIWVLMALIAPEIVLFTALSQHLLSRKLSRILKSIQENTAPDSEVRKFTFDTKYGFFVVMGGVQIPLARLDKFLSDSDLKKDLGDSSSDPDWKVGIDTARKHHQPTARLTTPAIVTLARLGCWVDIPPQHIEDRSKADGIQKSLILVQVSWMLVSCIARRLYGLPLTLLEIHTMVHVVCAFFIYFFWFEKPLDMRDPEPKAFPDSWDDALAYLCQVTFYRSSSERLKVITATQEAGLQSSGSNHACQIKRHNGAHLVHLPCNARAPTVYHAEYSGNLLDRIVHNPEVSTITGRWHATIKTLEKLKGDLSGKSFSAFLDQPRSDAFQIRHNRHNTMEDFSLVTESLDQPLRTWHLAGILVLPMIYGGIHLTAWSFAFPTLTETILWRVSCIVVIATLPLFSVAPPTFLLFWRYIAKFQRRVHVRRLNFFNSAYKMVPILGGPLFLILGILGALAIAFSRIFLVVESFISLRSVPVGVYWIPAWLQYIPHV